MKKQSEEILQLATNLKFRDWVLRPTTQGDEYWDKWMKAHPNKLSNLQDAREFILSSLQLQEDHTQEEIMDELDRLKSALNSRRIKHKYRLWYSVAASIAVCVAVTYFLFGPSTFKHDYQTGFGEKRDIILPDNSHVSLNSNSSIRYNDWDHHREIWLSGEAYFKVQKQFDTNLENIKFTVHTDDMDIEVIGTEFNVSQRQNGTEVSLNEGKILLKLKDQEKPEEIEMFPGEMIQYSLGSFTKRNVADNQFASWLDNRLVFERTPLIEIAKKIEENYGIKVVFEDKPTSERMISGTIPSDNLDILIRALSVTFSIDVIRNDDQLVFKRK